MILDVTIVTLSFLKVFRREALRLYSDKLRVCCSFFRHNCLAVLLIRQLVTFIKKLSKKFVTPICLKSDSCDICNTLNRKFLNECT